MASKKSSTGYKVYSVYKVFNSFSSLLPLLLIFTNQNVVQFSSGSVGRFPGLKVDVTMSSLSLTQPAYYAETAAFNILTPQTLTRHRPQCTPATSNKQLLRHMTVHWSILWCIYQVIATPCGILISNAQNIPVWNKKNLSAPLNVSLSIQILITKIQTTKNLWNIKGILNVTFKFCLISVICDLLFNRILLKPAENK